MNLQGFSGFGALMKSRESSLRAGKPVCEKSETFVCSDDGEVGLSGRLFGGSARLTLGLPVGRPSAKYCGQGDDNPLSLSFIFLSRPFVYNLS